MVYSSGYLGLVSMCFKLVEFQGETYLAMRTGTTCAAGEPWHSDFVLINRGFQVAHTINAVAPWEDNEEHSGPSKINSITVDGVSIGEGLIEDTVQGDAILVAHLGTYEYAGCCQLTYTELVHYLA